MIPVTVITGAVGAGKTRLAAQSSCRRLSCRLGVELGLPGDGGDEAVETLEHLCLCCTPRPALAARLEAVVAASRADRLVVESTGVADPAFLRLLVERRPRLRIDSVVCVVDAEHFGEFAALAPSGIRSIEYEQVAVASVVVVSKPLPLLDTIPALMGSRRVVLLKDANADLLQSDTGWRYETLLAREPSYFADATPYRRHHEHYGWASLVSIGSLEESQVAKAEAWIASLAWTRLKAVFYVTDGKLIILDGYRGNMRRMESAWQPGQEIACSKIVILGRRQFLDEATELQVQLERASGIWMQPAVQFAAPAPPVDTWGQRIVIILLWIALGLSPWPEARLRMWLALAVLIYFVLSLQRVAGHSFFSALPSSSPRSV